MPDTLVTKTSTGTKVNTAENKHLSWRNKEHQLGWNEMSLACRTLILVLGWSRCFDAIALLSAVKSSSSSLTLLLGGGTSRTVVGVSVPPPAAENTVTEVGGEAGMLDAVSDATVAGDVGCFGETVDDWPGSFDDCTLATSAFDCCTLIIRVRDQVDPCTVENDHIHV